MPRFCTVAFQADLSELERARLNSPVWINFKHGPVESHASAGADSFGMSTFNVALPGQLAVIGFEPMQHGFRLNGFAILSEGLRQVEIEAGLAPNGKRYLGTLRILSQSLD